MQKNFGRIDELMRSLIIRFDQQVLASGVKELSNFENQLVKDFVKEQDISEASVKNLIADVKRIEFYKNRMTQKFEAAKNKVM